jgi:hypothetical protein
MSRTTLIIILLLLLIGGGIFYLSSIDTEVPQTRMELDVTNEALAN